MDQQFCEAVEVPVRVVGVARFVAQGTGAASETRIGIRYFSNKTNPPPTRSDTPHDLVHWGAYPVTSISNPPCLRRNQPSGGSLSRSALPACAPYQPAVATAGVHPRYGGSGMTLTAQQGSTRPLGGQASDSGRRIGSSTARSLQRGNPHPPAAAGLPPTLTEPPGAAGWPGGIPRVRGEGSTDALYPRRFPSGATGPQGFRRRLACLSASHARGFSTLAACRTARARLP